MSSEKYISFLKLVCVITIPSCETFGLEQEPLGIRLCEGRCLKTQGCQGFYYDRAQLKCDLRNKNRNLKSFVYVKTKADSNRCDMKTCRDGERYILSRKGNGVCAGISVSSLRRRYQRLLILKMHLEGKSFVKFYELSLVSYSLKTFKFTKFKAVYRILYMAIEQKFIIATRDPRRIQLYDMDGKESRILCKSRLMVVTAMGLDEDRHILFYSILSVAGHIYRVSTKGRELAPLCVENYDKQSAVFGITAGKVNKVLYVLVINRHAGTSHILSLSYAGINTLIHFERGVIRSVPFVEDVLYYTYGNTVFKKYVHGYQNRSHVYDNQTSVVYEFHSTLRSLQFHNGELFAAAQNAKTLYIFNTENKTIRNVSIPSEDNKETMRLCLIN